MSHRHIEVSLNTFRNLLHSRFTVRLSPAWVRLGYKFLRLYYSSFVIFSFLCILKGFPSIIVIMRTISCSVGCLRNRDAIPANSEFIRKVSTTTLEVD